MNQQTRIYTDGSAIGNSGFGGWSAVICEGKQSYEIRGSSPLATASEMEITAAIKALECTDRGTRVLFFSDSQYLILGMRHLAQRWKRDGWRNRKGRSVRDRALWERLLECSRGREIQWVWIRGHNGHPIQCRADELAFQEARRLKLMARAA